MLSAPDLRVYTLIKSWKGVYKVRGWRDSFQTCNVWPLWWGLPVHNKILALMGCLPLPKGYVLIKFFTSITADFTNGPLVYVTLCYRTPLQRQSNLPTRITIMTLQFTLLISMLTWTKMVTSYCMARAPIVTCQLLCPKLLWISKFCLFVLRLNVPVNNFSVMSGRRISK